MHYFDGDYTAIGGSNSFVANQYGFDIRDLEKDLYNGNIIRMVTTITDPNSRDVLPLGWGYRYDQLNRLAMSAASVNLDLGANEWASADQTFIYNNDFSCDANGNILTQARSDETQSTIDMLTYYYPLDVSGKKIRNRLLYVSDLTDYDSEDIDPGMSTTNYQYDGEGRLVSDDQEEIHNITWRVDGKVSKIEHNSGSGKKNLSFDYDAMGHRIAKHVYDDSWSLEKSTYYLLDAQGNTMSVYEYVVDGGSSTVTYAQEEKYIYGSSRVGVLKESIYLLGSVTLDDDMSEQVHITGQRSYELTNHLGNVLSTVSDKIIPIYSTTPMYYNTFDYPGGTYSPFLSNGTISMSIATSGQLKAANASASNSIRHNITTVAGNTYRVTCDLDLGTGGNLLFYARDTPSATNIVLLTVSATDTGYEIQFEAQSTSTQLIVQNTSGVTRDFYVDNFEIDDVTVTGYLADIRQSTDYSPFGVTLHGRNLTKTGAERFRFGFQNQEMDDEIKEEGNSVNFEYRMHDPRLGRFFSGDPLRDKFPSNSPYAFSQNRVIDCIELEGLEIFWAADGKTYLGQVGTSTEVRICNTSADEIHVRNAIYKQNSGLLTDNPQPFSDGAKLQQEYGYDCAKAVETSTKAETFYSLLFKSTFARSIENTESKECKDVDLSNKVTFFGYKKSEPDGCLKRSNEMLKSAGYKPGNGSEVIWSYVNKIFNKDQHKKSVKFLNEQLEKGIPVIVGVDYFNPASPYNNDKVTDHWIIIVGKYEKDGSTFYNYFDPATAHEDKGTSKTRTLTLVNGQVQGKGILGNYKLSAVRKSKGKL